MASATSGLVRGRGEEVIGSKLMKRRRFDDVGFECPVAAELDRLDEALTEPVLNRKLLG